MIVYFLFLISNIKYLFIDDGFVVDSSSFFDGRCPSLTDVAPSGLAVWHLSPEGAMICLHRVKPCEKGCHFGSPERAISTTTG